MIATRAPADRCHRARRLGPAAAAHRARRAGPLPGPRPAPARARARPRADRDRRSRPTRAPTATRCAASRTVVHLAASIRDQPHATIEELNGIATWRLLRAAEQAGRRALRLLLRARRHAVAPQPPAPRQGARRAGGRRPPTCARRRSRRSLVYAPGDRRLALLERLRAGCPRCRSRAWGGRARSRSGPTTSPTASIAALDRRRRRPRRATSSRARTCSPTARSSSSRCAPRAAARRLVPVPAPVLRPLLRGYEALAGPAALATWDEAELLGVTMRTPRGTADAEALGVHPRAARRGPRRLVGAPARAARRPAAARPRAARRPAAACPRRAAGRRAGRWSAARRRRSRPGSRSPAGR